VATGNLRAPPGVKLYVTGVRGWMAVASMVVVVGCGASLAGSSHREVSAGQTTTATAPSTVSPPDSGSVAVGSVVTVVPPATTVSPTPAPERTTAGPTIAAAPPPTTAAPVPPPGSGVYGVVSAGPTCPVERAGQPCPPRPLSATVTATNTSTGTVASSHSDSLGRYTLPLPPGTYTVTATTGSAVPRCSPTTATVASGRAARADVTCDTGIR
jgi:carboxypeptidase family protein